MECCVNHAVALTIMKLSTKKVNFNSITDVILAFRANVGAME